MRPRRFALPQAGTGGYGIRPYVFLQRAESPRRGRRPAWSCLPLLKTRSVGAHSICARGGLSCRKRARADMESAPTFFCGGRSPLAEAVPRVELSPFVESEIRRGAFYMRPRRFILPQAGTGGYGIRPYVFLWRAEAPRRGRCPAWSCLPLLKARSVGAHSICARGGLSCRKRARADMESAPTFFVAGGGPSQRRCPAWSCLPLLKARSVGAHSICARGGSSYRKRARADMESAPTFFCRGGEGRVFACCACKRIYFRLRLVKNHLMWYTISLQIHRQTRCKPATQSYRGPSGQPVANKKLLFYCRR